MASICELPSIPTLERQTNQIGERDASLDLGHDACETVPCPECLIACVMNLALIKDDSLPMAEDVKTERIAHFEKLIAAAKAVCKKCEGSCSCTVIKDGKARFVCHAKKRRFRKSVE